MEVLKVGFWMHLVGLALMTLAAILAGETPGCSLEAKIAAAQVHANRLAAGIEGGWFAQGQPQPMDVTAALLAPMWPDLVDGALYFIGPGDAQRMPWLRERTGRWECRATWVESYR
jgi:hypothetical protein